MSEAIPLPDSDISTVRDTGASEPWGPRLWFALALVVIAAACLQSYGISTWPMADDEVPSLVELGLMDLPPDAFSVPGGQLGRLPRALPVWYAVQGFAISLLPSGEISYRIPSVVCGILTAAIGFLVAARWRGLWYAAALAIVLLGSQPFIFLSQVNRFYAMPLLLLALALVAIWTPRGGTGMVVLSAVLAALTVLSHNITVAVFVLTLLAAVPAFVTGRLPMRVLVRSGVAAVVSAAIYALYLRPLIEGWNSTGNPTPVLVSFAAHTGVPALALALFGSWLAIVRRDQAPLTWWTLMMAGSFAVFQFAFLITTFNWNPRYFLFFMPAVWILAAAGMEFVARRLGTRAIAGAWYGTVALLLLPGLFSHYQDGSRHDYRRAAEVLLTNGSVNQPILSDDAETISYYLPEAARRHLVVRTKVATYPVSEFFLVARANAWTPLPVVAGRNPQLLAEIFERRYDHFSHILRVYRVPAAQREVAQP